MGNDQNDQHAESLPVLLAQRQAAVEMREGLFDGATLWLTGGAFLLLWTAVALLLTST